MDVQSLAIQGSVAIHLGNGMMDHFMVECSLVQSVEGSWDAVYSLTGGLSSTMMIRSGVLPGVSTLWSSNIPPAMSAEDLPSKCHIVILSHTGEVGATSPIVGLPLMWIPCIHNDGHSRFLGMVRQRLIELLGSMLGGGGGPGSRPIPFKGDHGAL